MQKGDYVLATKYCDGDPGDSYCVGFFDGMLDKGPNDQRYMVVDNEGRQFRGNGHRRCEPITDAEGRWLIERFPQFEFMRLSEDGERLEGKSVWDWLAECRASTVDAQ